ncbi:hypothetical protein GGX14DRAFT_610853 [Mycena pura]|uniref:CCHC-type domain-containing protein n=1 Tax=Mycena pura TaxID=153505 RepID=A0AAD6VJ44_9AGAR|nr:hypothetical protein GGX14DRAFT_610853 [Mycena pura]
MSSDPTPTTPTTPVTPTSSSPAVSAVSTDSPRFLPTVNIHHPFSSQLSPSFGRFPTRPQTTAPILNLAPAITNMSGTGITAPAAAPVAGQPTAPVPAQAAPIAPTVVNPILPPVTRPRSRLDMPALKSRGAPTKFKGSPHDIAKFLSHLEKLFVVNNVTSDADKVESMAEYCSRKVVHILEGMPNYTTPNWRDLVIDMKTLFDEDKDQQRHRPNDLKKLTDIWRKQNIKSMSKWRRYLQEFTTIAGWLVHHQLMEEAECARYLWQGLHPKLRKLAEDRLLAQNPTRDMAVPFPQSDIIEVVSARFKRGRFDAEFSSDSSDSDSDSDSIQIAKARSNDPNELGDLVKQLSRMNIEDPEYNYLYYRATTLDPHVANCVRAPAIHIRAPPLPPNNFRNNQYVAPQNQYGPGPNRSQGAPMDRGCFGCGERGHGLWDCAKMAEALATGEIRRGDRGVEWADGSLLRRFNAQGETLLAAFQRQRQNRTVLPPPTAATSHRLPLHSSDGRSCRNRKGKASPNYSLLYHFIQFGCHASRQPKYQKIFVPVTGHRGDIRIPKTKSQNA